MSKAKVNIEAGFGFGAAMAMILSYSINSSIIWMIIHGVCSWIYVVYFAIKY